MNQSIRIVIGALGGEGGGVLGKWIADMASRAGYISQSTSVAGVAQRTGATIYYIEIFPRAEAEAAQKQPVMSMFPAPGDVDIVICSEIAEAGRMMQRGFVTPGRTTLITSTHRTYAIGEKAAMGNGIIDKQAIAEVAVQQARHLVAFDMFETARQFDTVINAALFGALAGSGALPFERGEFEQIIRDAGIAVDNNLQAFAASYDKADASATGTVQHFESPAGGAETFSLPEPRTVAGKAILDWVRVFPPQAQEFLYHGVKKLAEYQDYRYAEKYLERSSEILSLDNAPEGAGRNYELTREVARFLALWMAFEDLPRVAQIKISRERFAKFREEVGAEPGQQIAMVEFLHPRLEEFCGVMPERLGRYVLQSNVLGRLLGFFVGPRNVRTNSVYGFLSFYLISKLRHLRRSSLIYSIEQAHIERWLGVVKKAAASDYAAAVELAKCGRLIKGYGSTRERGTANMTRILSLFEQNGALTAEQIRSLRDAALSDEDGVTIRTLEESLLAA